MSPGTINTIYMFVMQVDGDVSIEDLSRNKTRQFKVGHLYHYVYALFQNLHDNL